MSRHLPVLSRSARAALARVFLFVAHLLAASLALAIAPSTPDTLLPAQNRPSVAGDEHVKSIWMFDIPSDAPNFARAATCDDGGIFVAGQAWTKADGESLWLWRIDRSGKKQWEKQIARPQRSESLEIVGLVPNSEWSGAGGERAAGGVTVVLKQGVKTFVRTLGADGEVAGELTLAGNDDTRGFIACANGDLLLLGMDMMRQDVQPHAYVARVDRTGRQLWRRSMIPHVAAADVVQAEPRKPLPGGVLHHELLSAGVELDDGSAVLVGQIGDYNKFGQGPSQLWLVRVSDDGEKLAEEFIDDGRTSARDLIVPYDDGVMVSYTTAQLPPIAGAPYNFPPSFPSRVACFSPDLRQLWEKELPNSGMPGAVPIRGPDPYASVSANVDDIVIRAWNKAGDELWRSVVRTPHSSVFPVAVVKSGAAILAVCNYSSHARRAGEERRAQVMVVRVAAPAR